MRTSLMKVCLVAAVIAATSSLSLASMILTPAAWGDVTSFKFTRAFNNQPTWDGIQPVGGDTSYEEFMASWESNQVSYIDLGENWADWRIEQTWTKYMKYRGGDAHAYAELWWDDDNDATNDGVAETALNFATQVHDSSGIWMLDVDTSAAPVVPQGRYLMLKQPATIPGNDVIEAAFVGEIVPEPVTLGLLMVGGLAVIARRCR